MKTMSKKEYDRDDAQRATRRHERRTPEERVTLLQSLLCSAGHDLDPSYTGVDPKTGPFQGAPVSEWSLKTLVYFVACRMMSHGTSGLSRDQRAKIERAVRDGIRMAEEHSRY